MDSFPHINRTPTTESEWFQALAALARHLRTPDGCPWDREQSTADFAAYLLDEAREFVEAAQSGDDAHCEEEFGDALFTLFAAAAAAEEAGRFTLESAMARIHEKMVRRHEHVFGDVTAATAEDALQVWEDAKRKERKERSQ